MNDEERLMLMQNLHIEPVEAEKDDTDLALGVAQAVERGYTEITIYGATGGRLITLWVCFKFYKNLNTYISL